MPSPIKPTLKTEIIPLILIIIAIIAGFYFYTNFAKSVPTHWNFAGQPDRWSSKTVAAFLMPAILVAVYLLFLLIPHLDPKKKRYQEFAAVYHLFKTVILFFFFLIYLLASGNALGYGLAIDVWMPIMVGLLFIILGNYLDKIKSNWFVGIRTPWTLSSERVWTKTHQFGKKVFILGGILMIAEPFLSISWRWPVLLFIILFIVFSTIGYSYFLYRQEEKN